MTATEYEFNFTIITIHLSELIIVPKYNQLPNYCPSSMSYDSRYLVNKLEIYIHTIIEQYYIIIIIMLLL